MGTTTFTDGTPVAPLGYTSPVYLYAGQVDVEFVWSQFGVNVRLDDDLDGASDPGLMNRALEKVSTEINMLLAPRYDISVLRQASWIKWACAYLAAVTIGRRRGNPVPDQLLEETKYYWESLTAMSLGQQSLILDSGAIAPPKHDVSPTVTNLIVDSRFGSSRIRRVPTTSTIAQQEGNRKQFDASYPFFNW